MSVLYCTVPHFATALARRDDPGLEDRPLVLIDPEGRVFGASAEAVTCGVRPGLPARAAEIRCPAARLQEADVPRCRQAFEALLQSLERFSPQVEPHGWGAAYVDLGDGVQEHADGVALCQRAGRAVRGELGQALQPALGWDSAKFTAQAAARRTRPGHLLAVERPRERAFLQPLPVALLPLPADALQRLGFLGLRTLGQYAALPPAAVGLQFGRAGQIAQRCARGKDDRPVVPRKEAPRRTLRYEPEAPLAGRERLLAVLQRMVAPALRELRERCQVCGQVRLAVTFEASTGFAPASRSTAEWAAQAAGSTQEQTRVLLFPTAEEGQLLRLLEQLLDGVRWRGPAAALAVALEQIQDVGLEQLALFPGLEGARDRVRQEQERKLREVQRYLAARFGAGRLRRAVLAQPAAPLPEWRAGWLDEEEA